MLPDQYHPRSQTFWDGRKQYDEECECGHIAAITSYYAPDVGRNWLKCTNENCGKRWV